jgi:SAM-dependent methyltransferase
VRVLVAIPSYGMKNHVYLERLLDEYRAMTHNVDIVVPSDIPRDLGPKVEVVIGSPAKDPWSLPFAHKQILADRLDDYDLFIYSEDDTLIQQRHIDAFLEMTEILPADRIAGFLRYEEDAAGRRYCSTMHSAFHWLPGSVQSAGSCVFAHFTNEHAAAYLLTQDQLRRAIASGGFLVPPHRGRYDLPCTASTDPYTQCGFAKVICLSRFEDFLLHHMPGTYLGIMGVPLDEARAQVQALLRCADHRELRAELFPGVSKLNTTKWDKQYYERPREEVLAAVPQNARQVLSVGCGAGSTEAALVRRNVRVVGMPMDTVIAESAKLRGIEVTPPDFTLAFEQLTGQRFDCVLLVHVLQYVRDPAGLLARCADLLHDTGRLVIVVPNFNFIRYRLERCLHRRGWGDSDAFERIGIHRTTARRLRQWVSCKGLSLTQIRPGDVCRVGRLVKRVNGFAGLYLSREIMAIVDKT